MTVNPCAPILSDKPTRMKPVVVPIHGKEIGELGLTQNMKSDVFAVREGVVLTD